MIETAPDELLADATLPQVERVLGSFGDAEVHVVYAARDLGRQLPLAWQEWVRNGGTAPFATYAARVLSRDSHRMARVFWSSHDIGDVLERWGAYLAPEQVLGDAIGTAVETVSVRPSVAWA